MIRDNMNGKEVEEVVLESRVRLASDLVSAEQRERKRMAQILHDDLQQQLYALQMQLQFLREKMDPGGAGLEGESDLKETLDQIESLVDASLDLTRNLMVDLSPPLPEGTSLLVTFDWLGEVMFNNVGLEVTVKGNDSVDELAHSLHLLLFQMVRELLVNVVKHAQVKDAEITIDRQEDGIAVTVSDEGIGFDVDRVMAQHQQKGGFGLHNMNERLKLFGRGADIQSAPGQGTRVTIFMPFLIQVNHGG